jgi:hypothetical protein
MNLRSSGTIDHDRISPCEKQTRQHKEQGKGANCAYFRQGRVNRVENKQGQHIDE